MKIVLAVLFLQFTGPSGHRIDVNADEITSIREAGAFPSGHFAKGTHCLIVTTSGKFIAVMEPCDEVRRTLRNGGAPCVRVCGETRP